MKSLVGAEVELHTFLTSALDGGGWSASRPVRFTSREKFPADFLIGGSQSRSGLSDEEKNSPL
jgi:hypothetical protein